jgi:hypothetical protein
VLKSLTPTLRQVLAAILEVLEEEGTDAVTRSALLDTCKESMIVSSDGALRQHIATLTDNSLVTERHGKISLAADAKVLATELSKVSS